MLHDGTRTPDDTPQSPDEKWHSFPMTLVG